MAHHKVIWQEGMLLRPQHFQQNDRYFDQQLKARTRQLAAHSWGFFDLEIERPFLSMGKLVLSRASGVMPDGTLFEIGTDHDVIAVDVPPNTRDTTAYLALALVTGNHVESRRAEHLDVAARYCAFDALVADSNAGETASSQVTCGRLSFRLLLGEQPPDEGYVKLAACRILETTADGVVEIDPAYVPTFLNIHSSTYLRACLKEVISLLGHRGDILAERIKATGKVAGAEIGDFLLLQMINRLEPVLRHLANIELVHPEGLYRELVSLAGELATYANEAKRPRSDCQYRHNDQGQSFGQLMEQLRQHLSMVLEQHAIELDLQKRQYGILVSPLPDHKLLGTSSFVIAASAQCDSESLRTRLPSHLKIGPVERIRQLVNLHLPGIKLKPMAVAPRQIPFHSDKTYFVLELSSDDVSQLSTSGGFAFHVSGDFADLELKFWAIRN